jgi:5-formyltetrahydrofolate cyclo-ligase
MSSKDALRAFMRAQRAGLSTEEARTRARAAADRLAAESRWREARVVALYMSVRGEMSTADLLAEALGEGKEILLPVCVGPGHMELAPYRGPEYMQKGAYGIPEPVREQDSPRVPDLIVLPGLAFDVEGYRLGAGAGYYDRLLARPEYARALCAGLAYAFQVVDRLPRDAWDIPVHGLCTETGTTWL